jgi:hypothetical protein
MNPYADKQYPPTLTLEWLRDQKLPIYVRNTTRPRGQVAINFPQQNGRVKVLKIPRIHLPVCLSDQMSYETILQSDDLRTCVVRGVLDLVRPDEAYTELSTEGGAAEMQQHTLSEFSAKQAFVSKRVRELEKVVEADPRNSPTVQALGVETNVITPRILALVEKLTHGDVSIKAALTELKTMEDELKETDCSYVISNGPDGQIRQFCQKVLAKIRNSGGNDYNVDDDATELTPEQQAEEARREALARQHQRV